MMHTILEHLERGLATPLPDGRTEIRFCVASCYDCEQTFTGTQEECVVWVKEHQAATGHRA